MLSDKKEYECSCDKCKSMCYISPCFPTPHDIMKLTEAGFINDFRPTIFFDITMGKSYSLLAPKAITGEFTDKSGNTTILNKCTFLDENDLCKLHCLGLKPTEGKRAIHNRTQEETLQLRVEICEIWNNSKFGIYLNNLMNQKK